MESVNKAENFTNGLKNLLLCKFSLVIHLSSGKMINQPEQQWLLLLKCSKNWCPTQRWCRWNHQLSTSRYWGRLLRQIYYFPRHWQRNIFLWHVKCNRHVKKGKNIVGFTCLNCNTSNIEVHTHGSVCAVKTPKLKSTSLRWHKNSALLSPPLSSWCKK